MHDCSSLKETLANATHYYNSALTYSGLKHMILYIHLIKYGNVKHKAIKDDILQFSVVKMKTNKGKRLGIIR